MTTIAQPLAAGYELLCTGTGLIDRSQRGRLALTGADAVGFLNGQVSNDIAALETGEGCYATFLTHKGKMLGDLRILAVSAPDREDAPIEELLLETERVALQSLFDMIRRFKIGYDVELEKRTLQTCLLSLLGPEARTVLRDALAADVGSDGAGAGARSQPLPSEREHSHLPATIRGHAVRLICTAAPSGVDVLCDSDDRDAVEAALLHAGARVVSEEVAEILRVEHGRPRYGVDLDETVIPQEAGLNERAVSFTKGCYVGQETVARLFYRGRPNRRLRGLKLSEAVAPGSELLIDDRAVGTLTSSLLSPRLGALGLALLRREVEQGATLSVSGAAASATVCELPFAR
jgi:tRNA-modifying protein YgfZ